MRIQMQKPGGLSVSVLMSALCVACGSNGSGTTTDPVSKMLADPLPLPMVFTMTNDASANMLQAYSRPADGTLVSVATLPTGGAGVGHGLENQGALALSTDHHYLLVINPGSNDVSVFHLSGQEIRLTDRVPSGGTLPVSVAEWNGVVYVLNRNSADGSGSVIQGFQLSSAGKLSPLNAANRSLRATANNAAQVSISPDGQWLVVTERQTNEIDLVPLDLNRPGAPIITASTGAGPFGFAFSSQMRLYVSEAAAGTASAYNLDAQGKLLALSAAVATQQRGTCWLAISPNDQQVYVSNTASHSISSYSVAEDGSMSLLISVAASTMGAPLDISIDDTGQYLSVLTTDGSIETFRINSTSGELAGLQTISGLPSGANGLERS